MNCWYESEAIGRISCLQGAHFGLCSRNIFLAQFLQGHSEVWSGDDDEVIGPRPLEEYLASDNR